MGEELPILLERLHERQDQKKEIDQRITQLTIRSNQVTAGDIVQFLTRFKNGDISSPALDREIINVLIQDIVVSTSEDKIKIAIVCNTIGNSFPRYIIEEPFDLGSDYFEVSGAEGVRNSIHLCDFILFYALFDV